MNRPPLLLAILAAVSACAAEERFEAQACLLLDEAPTACPGRDDMPPELLTLTAHCGDDLHIVRVKSEGEVTTVDQGGGEGVPACCYWVEVVDEDPGRECAIGRPYHEPGGSRRARVLPSTERGAGTVDRERRRGLAWSNAGAAEHASVAAFGRLALRLLALGAPAELVRDTHRAALDELGHAELCWSLARHFGEPAGAAGPFPFGGPIEPTIDLPALAVELVRDGCIEETLGAYLATELASSAPEPEVRAVLTTIASEEAEHAVLAFRILAWVLRAGGPEVRAAAREAFSAARLELALDELSLRTGVAVPALRAAAERGVREVLEPARERVLAA